MTGRRFRPFKPLLNPTRAPSKRSLDFHRALNAALFEEPQSEGQVAGLLQNLAGPAGAADITRYAMGVQCLGGSERIDIPFLDEEKEPDLKFMLTGQPGVEILNDDEEVKGDVAKPPKRLRPLTSLIPPKVGTSSIARTQAQISRRDAIEFQPAAPPATIGATFSTAVATLRPPADRPPLRAKGTEFDRVLIQDFTARTYTRTEKREYGNFYRWLRQGLKPSTRAAPKAEDIDVVPVILAPDIPPGPLIEPQPANSEHCQPSSFHTIRSESPSEKESLSFARIEAMADEIRRGERPLWPPVCEPESF